MRLNVHRRMIAVNRPLHRTGGWNVRERIPGRVNPPCSVNRSCPSGRSREYSSSDRRSDHASSRVRRNVTIVRNGKVSALQALTASHDSLKAGRSRRNRSLGHDLIAEEDNTS